MKKTFNYLLMSLVAVTLSMGFVACSSDDDEDGGNFETPEFESDAAKYEIEDASSTYSSIELTASGNYIIEKNDWSYAATRGYSEPVAIGVAKMFACKTAKTRASEYARVLYGKYTKLGDGKYALEGFGILEINFNAADNAYSLEVTPNGGTTETVTASKTHIKADGTKTNSLCRTWKFVKFREIAKVNGKTYFDITFKSYEEFFRKAYEATGDEEWLDELEYLEQYPEDYAFPEEVIFTKSGTYVVFYSDGTLDTSFWRWYDEGKGIMQFSWEDSFEEVDEEDLCYIAFKSGQCIVTSKYAEYDGDEYGDEYKVEYESISYMEEI